MKIEIKSQVFHLLPERALFWEQEKVLICSDLHWGRESYLQKQGMAVPERSFEKESLILHGLLQNLNAKEFWILGDLIHHPEGLHEQLINQMKTWFASLSNDLSVKVSFVPGNHDRGWKSWAPLLGVEIEENGIERKGFTFLHDHPKTTKLDQFYWYGHLHPAFRIEALFGNRKVPCFFIRNTEAYLPAFSRLAGGAALVELKGTDRVYGVAEGEVFEWNPLNLAHS